MGRIRVYVADWQVLFRKGIRFTLSRIEDVEVVDDTSSNEEALKFIESNLPDVAILNINDSKPSGIQITRTIKKNLPSVSVILVMDHQNDEHLFSAMESGASACIPKDIAPEHLASIISDVARGAKPISKALLRAALARRVLGVEDVLAKLSVDEADILNRVAGGNSGELTAGALGMGEGPLNLQLASILSKLIANEEVSQERLLARPRADSPQGRVAQLKGGLIAAPIKEEPILATARLVDFLRSRGYKVEELAKVKGKSGVVHSLDILASRDDLIVQHHVGIGIFTAKADEAEVSIDDLLSFQAKAVDMGIHNLIVVAIPKLSSQAQSLAETQQIKVLTVKDIMDLSPGQSRFTSVTETAGAGRVRPEVTEKAAATAAQAAAMPADLRTVLWIDKDLASSVEFARVLKIAGFEVMAFVDPDDGLQKVNEASLVVLDDELSRTGQVCSRIRNQSSVPIVLIGSGNGEEVSDGAESAGADAYLRRSISGRELVARVRSILRRR